MTSHTLTAKTSSSTSNITSSTVRKSAVRASRQISSTSTTSATEKTLLKVRANRQKRQAKLNSKGALASKKKRKFLDETERLVAQQDSKCFICGLELPADLELINQHIDGCLKQQEMEIDEEMQLVFTAAAASVGRVQNSTVSSSSSSRNATPSNHQAEGGEGEDDWEEYTWAGQTRVRLTSLFEGDFASAAGFSVNRKTDKDVEEDIDIDDDGTEEFGAAQYGEEVLQQFYQQQQHDRLGQDEPNAIYQHKEQQEYAIHASISASSSSSSATAATNPLVIESLKMRIRELENRSKGTPTHGCMICLEEYKKPLVSVNCWHVHCELCWFQAMGTSKRVCPQCQVITAPADLRQIYI